MRVEGWGEEEKKGRESERISPGLGVTGTNLLVGNYKCFGRFDFITLCLKKQLQPRANKN